MNGLKEFLVKTVKKAEFAGIERWQSAAAANDSVRILHGPDAATIRAK